MNTKISIVVALLLFSLVPGQAQTTDNTTTSTEETKSVEKASKYLPQAGNFAIGVDATPVFDFVGNIFNSSSYNTLDLSRTAIYGKYYLSDMTAIRGVLAIGSTSHTDANYVRDDAAWYADPLSNKQAVDKKTVNNSDYFVSVAMQKFVGKNRLRGFYGAQVLGGTQHEKSIYAYGNPMSELNPTPSSAYGYTPARERALEVVNINAVKIGVGAIAGFEYFILPRVCIGGEISLNAIYTHNGQLYSKSEKMENDELVKVDVANSPGSSDFAFQTFRFTPNGYTEQLGFYVMFHF